MWFERVRGMLAEHEGALHIRAGEAHGVPFILAELTARRPTAWLQVPVASGDGAADAVVLGNRLAQAVNRSLAGDLLPFGMPFAYHLRAVRHYRPTIVPLTLIVQHAEHAPRFAAEVVALHGQGIDVITTSEIDDPPIPGARALEGRRLELDLDEARDLAPAGAPEALVAQAFALAQGRAGDYLRRLHEALDLAPVAFPAPGVQLYARSDAPREEPELVIEALLREDRLQDAFELVVLAEPGRALDLLPRAAPRFQADGNLGALRDLLDRLPPTLHHHPRVLEWRLVANFPGPALTRIRTEVEERLELDDDPDLRARYAGTLPPERGAAEAERAYRNRRTTLTAWQFGRLHTDFGTSVRALHESLRLAESDEDPVGMVRAGGALAERHLHHGNLFEATTWSSWALERMNAHRLRDGNRRLRIFNILAFGQVLRGDTLDIGALEREHTTLEGILPDMARIFRTTLAAAKMASRQVEEARELLRGSYDTAPRRQKGRFGYLLVLALLELGDEEGARRVAAEAAVLTRDAPSYYGLFSALAGGLVGAATAEVDGRRAADAAAALRRVAASSKLAFDARASAAIALVHATESTDDLPETMLERLADIPEAGLRALSAPSAAMAPTWRLLRGEVDALVVRLFGEPSFAYRNKEFTLPLRLQEVLAALLLSDRPLRTGELHALVVADDDPMQLGTLRSHVARLRRCVPVSDQPYALDVDTRFDYREGMRALHQGRVRDALALRRGVFLAGSEAPVVVEARAVYESALREAALAGSDLDTTFDLAERERDDLQLWEVLAERLPVGDPRRAIANANVRRIRSDWGVDLPD